MPRSRSTAYPTPFARRLASLIGDEPLREFAKRCRLPPSSISNYLTSIRKPSADSIAAIVRGTGCDAQWLLTGTPARARLSPERQADLVTLRNALREAEGALADLEQRIGAIRAQLRGAADAGERLERNA
jgi:transcriptional regulator with XRE-family HTH domain